MTDLLTVLGILAPWLTDALVILGLFVMTIGVYGIFRMPDSYTQLHASSKMVFLGVMPFLLASVMTGDTGIIFRVILIGVFLILTTPVSAHVIALAAFQREHKMTSPEAVDESGRGLNSRSTESGR